MYTSPKGEVKIEVVFQDENIWLSQKKMGELFNVESHTVTYHLKEIFKSQELDENSTARKIRVVQNEGNRAVTREIDFYNLDAIIAVGYRVNSYEATQFRIWATQTLKEFIIKGFVMDDERLKNGAHFGKDSRLRFQSTDYPRILCHDLKQITLGYYWACCLRAD